MNSTRVLATLDGVEQSCALLDLLHHEQPRAYPATQVAHNVLKRRVEEFDGQKSDNPFSAPDLGIQGLRTPSIS